MSAMWAAPGAPDVTPNEELENGSWGGGTNGVAVDQDSRPVLRGLPRLPPRLARMPFVLVLIALFGLGMTGLLMLNTTLQNQAFQVSTLHRQASELAYAQAGLESQLDQQAAPQELARRASALGLRPNPYPAFLSLPSGKVLGKPQRVTGAEAPALVIKTPIEVAAERAAAAARAQARAEQRAAKARAAAEEARLQAAQDAVNKQTAEKKKAVDKQTADATAQKKTAQKKRPVDKKTGQKKTAQKKTAESPRPAKPTGRG